MSKPSWQVLIYFGTTATGSTVFTLNDTTRGVLDSATYTLGGDTGTDVTAKCMGVEINRGKSGPIFEEYDAGTCTLTFKNQDRYFDPLYAAGAQYGNLKPGKRVRVLANGIPIFDGRIADWNLSYDVSGRSVATAVCEDALAVLARKQFDQWTATASQTAGPRITAILNRSEVSWPSGQRSIGTGISTLQGDLVTWGSNVLNYCQQVAKSDLGAFYVSRDGLVTFKDRHSLLNTTPAVSFADNGTGVEFTGVEMQIGAEEFYTRVSVDREGGTAQTYSTTSAATDDIYSLSISGLLLDSDAQALNMATYLAQSYSQGNARVSGVTTVIDDSRHTAAEISALLSLDLNKVVAITWTPNRVGTAISDSMAVIGVQHSITPDLHTMQVVCGRYDNRTAFVLDDATYGVLDTGPGVLQF